MLTQALHLIADPTIEYGRHSWDYLRLCALAIALAMAVALPLGVLLARRPIAAFLVTNASGMARAIPPIVVLLFFVLLIHVPGLGFGFAPAVLALTVLGISPILLNTIAGLRAVDPAVTDAARGMGMTNWQILIRIEIPLVLPVVAAGVRTSAVQIVATGTIAGVFGAGGYGEYIYLGIFRGGDMAYILIGAVPVALLALVAEVGLGALERALTPRGTRPNAALRSSNLGSAGSGEPEVTPARARA